MKAIKIDQMGGVKLTEWVFGDNLYGDDLNADMLYDAISLGHDHAIYVDDEALFRDSVVVARIGDFPNVPLPAIIVGAEGEHDIDATLTVEQVIDMVGEVRRVR